MRCTFCTSRRTLRATTSPFGIILSWIPHLQIETPLRGKIALTILCSISLLFATNVGMLRRFGTKKVPHYYYPKRRRGRRGSQGSANERATHLVGVLDSCTQISPTQWVSSRCADVKIIHHPIIAITRDGVAGTFSPPSIWARPVLDLVYFRHTTLQFLVTL